QKQAEKTEIGYEFNPQNLIGTSMTKEHRLIYFKVVQTELFYIDFVQHSGTTNTIYLIPSGHILYLPNSITKLYCINIPQSCTNEVEQYWINTFKYRLDKSITYPSNTIKLHQTNFLSQFLNPLEVVLDPLIFSNFSIAKQFWSLIQQT